MRDRGLDLLGRFPARYSGEDDMMQCSGEYEANIRKAG
jgi:hypothetical protein